jgi:hypothetical protein
VVRYSILTCLFLLVVLFNLISCTGKESSLPILILADESNFGSYTGEILKAEGFNEFKLESPANRNVSLDYLNKYDLIILAETKVTEAQRNLYFNYVKGGGHLIAFRPDKALAPLFGLGESKGTMKEGYIKIDGQSEIGNGLISKTLQFHGTSDLYEFKGGEKVAALYSNANDSTDYPSIVVANYGKGRAAAFTYNLSQSIVYTRQGNPEWAGQERDNVDGPTATDLFCPKAGQAQWNDPSKIAIPQADEQMRLLSHIIENFNSDQKPLPRFWYFPDDHTCIFMFTIDGENNKESEINSEILDVQSKGGNATLYEIGTYISPSRVNEWRFNGNEVAVHYNDVPNYANPTYGNMITVMDTMTSNFHHVYGYSSKTVRNHWVVWVSKDSAGNREFAEQARLEEKYGIGMDCNYYQFGGNKVYPNWMGDVGHITGSGLPMKFADTKGSILNIYQSNTQLPDETWLKENIENKSKTLINRSLDEENYTWINANYHTWYWPETRNAGLNVLDYCRSRGVPVWTAEKAYEFLKMKDEASFGDIKWNDNQLSFTLNSLLEHSDGLTCMVPFTYSNKSITEIIRDGKTVPYSIKKVKGITYAFATVKSGKSHRFLVRYKT